MIRCKYYKKIIIWENISLFLALWWDMFITDIALNPNSLFLCQFYLGNFLNFANSTIIVFFIAAVIIRCLQQIVAFLRGHGCCSSLDILYSQVCQLVSSFLLPQFFRPWFAATNLWVSRLLRRLYFLGKFFSGFPQNFFAIQSVLVTVKWITVKVT